MCTEFLVNKSKKKEMKSRELALLLANTGQVIALAKTLNINKDAIDRHTETVRAGQKRLDGYTLQFEDKEYMATLSPAEKQNLSMNAQNVYTTLQSLNRELDYLEMSRQNSFVINAIHELEHVYLLAEYIIETVFGRTGETILPHLSILRPKTFEQGKYKNQIENLYAEVEAIAWDFHEDHIRVLQENMAIPICDHLSVASMWFKREKERLVTEPVSEIKKIDLPAETTPVVPEGPTEHKEKEHEMEKPLQS